MQRQLEGESYVTISNVNLAVCGILEVLSSARTDEDVCQEVKCQAYYVYVALVLRYTRYLSRVYLLSLFCSCRK